ncbi:MAG: ketol-acid reductoisomerase [Candidatus Gastranaerophilales bacterium]|nr:ketol-acid reductoisomerase [Candidatus Gastranaerophilales bacterium]
MITKEKLRILYDKDIDTNILRDKKIAVLGFGNQGMAQALNLRDSGANIKIGIRSESQKIESIKKENIVYAGMEETVRWADVILMLIPDECHKEVYENHIKNNIKPGAYLVFAHGFSIHFEQIVPREDINVIMVSPKGAGPKVRSIFEAGGGVPALVAIHQDPIGDSKQIALAYAGLIGSGRSGILETTFKEETEADLFGEQAVLCGGVNALVKAAFETLVDAGFSPQMAYFECFHELKILTDLLYENGITETRKKISNTARYGDLTRGPRIISDESRKAMQEILSEIQSGKFAEEWIGENKNGKPLFNALTEKDKDHEIEIIGMELRNRMGWLKS